MTENPEFQKALTKARMDMLRKPKAVFISTITLMVKQKMTDKIPTAATDGITNFYNPDFFLKLPRAQRVTLLAHEAMHPALLHLDPCYKHLDQDRLNRAGDYVINDYLVNSGFEPIPNWLYDPKYHGMTTMQVYRALDDEDAEKRAAGEPVPDIGDWADLGDPLEEENGKPDPGQQAANIEAVRTMIASAAQAVTMAQGGSGDPGTIPADVQAFIDGLLKPKLPMATHLRRFFNELDKSDYSWMHRNRRFQTVIMPGLRGKKLSHIAFAFDISGSVSDLDLKRYKTELHFAMRRLKPDRVTLLQFDTAIKSVHVIKSVQDLANVEFRGRGGTCIECVLDWAKENKPTAVCVFSDGQYGHPSYKPASEFMWMIHGGYKDAFHCDFGTTIRFESADDD